MDQALPGSGGAPHSSHAVPAHVPCGNSGSSQRSRLKLFHNSKTMQTWGLLSLWWWHREIVALERPWTDSARTTWDFSWKCCKASRLWPWCSKQRQERFTQGLSDVTSWQMPHAWCRAESLNKNQRICSWFTNLDLGLSLEELREGSGCPGAFDGAPRELICSQGWREGSGLHPGSTFSCRKIS